MMRFPRKAQDGGLSILLAAAMTLAGEPASFGSVMPPAGAELRQEAYVWQRAWTEPVREAVTRHAAGLSGLTVLAAEVSWPRGRPDLIRVPLDHAVLTNVPFAIGLAFRIGPCPGELMTNSAITAFLAETASSLVAEARSHNVSLRELQIDFDCAESNLDRYRTWVETFRRQVHPVPVTITALPSWLDQPAFKSLAMAATGYVLQVHSLQQTKKADASLTLCNPAAARRAVEQAARLGVPFRVALPTYGYRMTRASTREVRADPLELAELVRLWTTNRPSGMEGILWYRLPVEGEPLNWRWPTLAAVMAARIPRESVRAEPRHVEPGLVEILLVNDGDLDISAEISMNVRWDKARLMAADALDGFLCVDDQPSAVRFQNRNEPWRLQAGEQKVIGWLRLSEASEVKIEIERQ